MKPMSFLSHCPRLDYLMVRTGQLLPINYLKLKV
nr:MAG TPA: hypothetical protein [Caudoviricetes sp.]